MGIWDVIKRRLVLDENRHHSDVDDNIGRNVFEIASFDIDNASLADRISYFLNNRSQGEQIQLADKLLREGPYEASIEMYNALIKKYPEERDRYENGIGTAYLKLEEYDKAIEYYLLSFTHGMHPTITDKNIWEVCHQQYKKTNQLDSIENYAKKSPGDKYLSQAHEILGRPIVVEKETIVSEPEPTNIEEKVFVNEEELVDDIENEDNNDVFTDNENIEDVSKRNKQSDENQFSLFGFGEESDTSKEKDSVPEKAEELEEPKNIEEDGGKKEESDNVVQQEYFDQEQYERIPVDEAPNMLLALDHHIDKFFDNEDVIVWRDKRNDDLRVDVYHIRPNEERNYNLLVSYGMSRKPMNVPEGADQFKYGELAIVLPEDWDLSPEGLKKHENYWPILWLKNLARIPVQHNTWLCYGHSVPHGSPSKPIANTEFEGVVIMDSVTLPDEFQEMQLGDEFLYIYTVIPIFPEEMEFKIKNNIDELRSAFAQAHVIDKVDIKRSSSISSID